MRRLLRILTGFVFAMLAAAVTVVLFAFPPVELAAMDAAERGDRALEMGTLLLQAATHAAIFTAGFAPIVILIAEWQRLRDWSYYVITGMIISSGGFLAQYASENASQPTIINNYALIAFLTTGAVGGLAYWIAAGHNAGRRRRPARLGVAQDEEAAKAATEKVDTPAPDDLPGQADVKQGQNVETAGPPHRDREAEAEVAQDVQHDRGKDGEAATADGGQAAGGADGEGDQPQPMTSVPTTGAQNDRRRLKVATTVPDAGLAKPAKA